MEWNRIRLSNFVIFITVFYLFVFPRNVYAYIDPGSGSYLIQVILGFVFGGVFMVKLYWKRIKDAIFKKNTKTKKEEISEKD
jgi:hypothetical protein